MEIILFLAGVFVGSVIATLIAERRKPKKSGYLKYAYDVDDGYYFFMELEAEPHILVNKNVVLLEVKDVYGQDSQQ